jgi:hypothetical protein
VSAPAPPRLLGPAEGSARHWPDPYGPDPAVFGPPDSGQGRDPWEGLLLPVAVCRLCGVRWHGDPQSRCWCCGQPASAF